MYFTVIRLITHHPPILASKMQSRSPRSEALQAETVLGQVGTVLGQNTGTGMFWLIEAQALFFADPRDQG